jgi:hypothetical protein
LLDSTVAQLYYLYIGWHFFACCPIILIPARTFLPDAIHVARLNAACDPRLSIARELRTICALYNFLNRALFEFLQKSPFYRIAAGLPVPMSSGAVSAAILFERRNCHAETSDS